MDLSAFIFLGLAAAWALYLIPKAIGQQNELAKKRGIDTFSDDLRVLSKSPAPASANEDTSEIPLGRTVDPALAGQSAAPSRTSAGADQTRRQVRSERRQGAPASTPAARRRRVVGVFLFSIAVLAGLAPNGLVPWWSLAIPGGLIVLFLVMARGQVRREQAARRARRVAAPAIDEEVEVAPVDVIEVEVARVIAPAGEAEAAQPAAVADEVAEVATPAEEQGSLWDPLPMTLPTYVNKAPASRTVRTIDLSETASSGHNADDSKLAADADAARRDVEAAQAETQQRRAAGA